MVTIIHDDTMAAITTLAVIALKVSQDWLPIVFRTLEIVSELPASCTIPTVYEILQWS
jgi:hypothetical protein